MSAMNFCVVIPMGDPRIDVMVEEEEKMREETVVTTGGREIEVEEVVVEEEGAAVVASVETELMEVEAVRIGSR